MFDHIQEGDEAIKKMAHKFLQAHRKMVLAVNSQSGYPSSSLVLYAVDDEFVIYFGTRKSFGKYDDLKKNNKVSLAIVEDSIDPLQVVDLQGIVEQIDEKHTEQTLDWFTGKNPTKSYVADQDDFVMFRIRPTGIRWLDATFGTLNIYNIKV